ncbi:LexA family protein [Mucilaginibacter defluvii]|uniref:Peptidase S24/S26A/S26B/S26C domain-containing protein n=1 Tax=Mucilaginibacter defluvii TaxID=1196019 RepID=A0ABP9FRZ6_9SPHI
MIRKYQQRAEQDVSGFKSPADDYLEGRLNIVDRLVIDPECTFYFQMDSNSMKTYGLRSGDLLIIDRSMKAVKGAIVVAYVNGAFHCRSYETENGRPFLKGDTDRIETTDGEVLQIWGVVTAICRNTLPSQLRKGDYERVCTL